MKIVSNQNINSDVNKSSNQQDFPAIESLLHERNEPVTFKWMTKDCLKSLKLLVPQILAAQVSQDNHYYLTDQISDIVKKLENIRIEMHHEADAWAMFANDNDLKCYNLRDEIDQWYEIEEDKRDCYAT